MIANLIELLKNSTGPVRKRNIKFCNYFSFLVCRNIVLILDKQWQEEGNYDYSPAYGVSSSKVVSRLARRLSTCEEALLLSNKIVIRLSSYCTICSTYLELLKKYIRASSKKVCQYHWKMLEKICYQYDGGSPHFRVMASKCLVDLVVNFA